MIRKIILLLFLIVPSMATANEILAAAVIGILYTGNGVQQLVYPSGMQSLILVRSDPLGKRFAGEAFVGTHLTDRRNWSHHHSEKGMGWGGGVGMRAWANQNFQGWNASIRTEVWGMHIFWANADESRVGISDVVLVQPTLDIGYTNRSKFSTFEPTISIADEHIVSTRGGQDQISQGIIVRFGILVGW